MAKNMVGLLPTSSIPPTSQYILALLGVRPSPVGVVIVFCFLCRFLSLSLINIRPRHPHGHLNDIPQTGFDDNCVVSRSSSYSDVVLGSSLSASASMSEQSSSPSPSPDRDFACKHLHGDQPCHGNQLWGLHQDLQVPLSSYTGDIILNSESHYRLFYPCRISLPKQKKRSEPQMGGSPKGDNVPFFYRFFSSWERP